MMLSIHYIPMNRGWGGGLFGLGLERDVMSGEQNLLNGLVVWGRSPVAVSQALVAVREMEEGQCPSKSIGIGAGWPGP